MIRPCTNADIPQMDSIINEAAEKYRGVIPADCWHEPYMSRRELESEIAAGVRFSGWDEAGELVGVMGVQTRQRRHADPSRLCSHRATRPRDWREVADRTVAQCRGAPVDWHLGRRVVGDPFLPGPRLPADADGGEEPPARHLLDDFRIGSAIPRWSWPAKAKVRRVVTLVLFRSQCLQTRRRVRRARLA